MVYLDGLLTEEDKINPKEHKFIGMWRPPINPHKEPTGYIQCTCGHILQYRGQEIEHYNKGCYDVPQYVTIKEQA